MTEAGESEYVIAGGGSDVDDQAILRLEDWMYLFDSGYDWDYLVEPQEKGNTHKTVYHPACTAKMGPDSDPMAVLDPRLRVRGVSGPRIAAGSMRPLLPAVNPCITTMMVGEKCADMIKQDARSEAQTAAV